MAHMVVENKAYTRSRRQSGYSLTELLVTLAILMLVTSIMAAGAPAALRAYMGVVDASNANVLLTTTATRLRDELSMANPDVKTMEFETKGGKKVLKSFVSLETGYRITFKYDGSGYLYKEEQSTAAAESGTTTIALDTPLVPEKASAAARASKDLRVTYNTITYADGVFTIHDLRVVQMDSAPSSAGAIAGDTVIRGTVVGGAEYKDEASGEDLMVRVLAAAG